MKKILSLLFTVILFQHAFSQDQNFWRSVSESSIGKDLFQNRFKPSVYKIFQLDELPFVNELKKVPSEKNTRASQSGFIISIPNADGSIQRFRAIESSVMDPALSAKFPGIKSFAGQGVDDPSLNIRFDISPRGFHGMITSANSATVYIDPVDRQAKYYVVFSRKDILNFQKHFNCGTDVNATVADGMQMPDVNRLAADDGKLRSYRLALASTGEYSQYFLNGTETSDGERKAKVLAAMNTLMTRTNQIYERDFGIRMVLVANNDAIIYLNPSTDPWTTEWNSKTQQTIDAVIGSANYDIGHLVHKESSFSNNNGNAGCIGCVCVAGRKGSAFTSHYTPEGDPFVVDYTTHEMGHQFGANHTFTFSNEGTTVQVEPGSGSTIMGYAGITGATNDVQPHSDDYFHSKNIEQVSNFIKGITGGGCAVITTTGNTAPFVNAGADYTIPKSTPFAITGSASDADAGNVLQYCWEQIDNRATGSYVVPNASATTGPAFRSYNYTNSLTRTVPQLPYILSGANGYKWEVLPGVSRYLNFRFTARDNNPGGGNNNTDDIRITVSTAGPFAVTAPNTAVTWNGGSNQTVTWSVNSTNLSPVNCLSVKISLSTDGGQTFPVVLASSTGNDGSELVTLPNIASTSCRIKVEAVGNIFFDISNANFTINSTVPVCGTPAALSASAITNTGATINWAAVTDATSYDVDYKLNSSADWISAAVATPSTTINLTGLTEGSVYDWRVRATCPVGNSSYAAAQFTTTAPATCGIVSGLASSSVTSSTATISWSALSGAVNYDVDYKESASATWINVATATTSTSASLSGLTETTNYDWRVRANCAELTGNYAAAQFTTTSSQPSCVSAYEPNETLATAAAVTTNSVISAAIGSSTDVDYYKITTTATSNFNVSLTNLPADYDMVMYNSAGTQIGSATAAGTSNESIVLNNQVAGTYYIRIFGYNGANSTTVCYNLNIGATTVTGCQSSYDNATNGTISGAATIPFNTNITGLINVSSDVDNYKFVITTPGSITLTLSTLPADYDLKLLSSTGSQLAVAQRNGTSNETITYNVAAGTYYANVYPYKKNFNATSCYTLKVQTGTASRTDLPVTKTGIQVYPNPVNEMLNLSLPKEFSGKSILTVTDVNGKVVRAERINSNIQTLNVSGLPGGVYMIKVQNGAEIVTSKFIKL